MIRFCTQQLWRGKKEEQSVVNSNQNSIDLAIDPILWSSKSAFNQTQINDNGVSPEEEEKKLQLRNKHDIWYWGYASVLIKPRGQFPCVVQSASIEQC